MSDNKFISIYDEGYHDCWDDCDIFDDYYYEEYLRNFEDYNDFEDSNCELCDVARDATHNYDLYVRNKAYAKKLSARRELKIKKKQMGGAAYHILSERRPLNYRESRQTLRRLYAV